METNMNNDILSLKDMNRQAFVYSYLNTLSLSFFSGLGITDEFKEDEIESFKSKVNAFYKEEKELNTDFLKNINPLLAIYSKTKLDVSFMDNSDDIKNILLTFDSNKFSNEISPRDQALLIINELNLAKYLHHNSLSNTNQESTPNDKLIGVSLFTSAVRQIKFLLENLMDTDDFFYSIKYKPKEEGEKDFKLINTSFDWENQSFILLAFAKMYNLINNPKYPLYKDVKTEKNVLEVSNKLLDKFISNEENIVNLNTNNLAAITCNFIQSIVLLDKADCCFMFILSLGDELKSREVNREGYILLNNSKNNLGSLATHFQVLEAMVHSYKYTDFYCFKDIANRIYDNLHKSWDEDLGLFNIHKKNKIKYTSKNIAQIINSLNTYAEIIEDENQLKSIVKQVNTFFDSSINITGLQVLPQTELLDGEIYRSNYDNFFSLKFFEDQIPYIALRGFVIDQGKNKIGLYGHTFYTEYTLALSESMMKLNIR